MQDKEHEVQEALNDIDFLARSANRVQLLQELPDREQLERDDIKACCEASRTTIQRNLNAIEERGWIQNTNQTYSLTLSGEIVIEAFSDLVETIQLVRKLQPVLNWFPRELAIDFTPLRNVTVVTPDPSNPYAPVNRHIEAMESADWFRCMLPAIGLQPMTIAHKRVVHDGCTHEVIVDEGVAETLRSDSNYTELVDEMIETGHCHLYVYDGDFSFYLGLTDKCVQIGVEDDDGVPRGLMEIDADSQDVRKWAEEIYAEYKQQATPFI